MLNTIGHGFFYKAAAIAVFSFITSLYAVSEENTPPAAFGYRIADLQQDWNRIRVALDYIEAGSITSSIYFLKRGRSSMPLKNPLSWFSFTGTVSLLLNYTGAYKAHASTILCLFKILQVVCCSGSSPPGLRPAAGLAPVGRT
jgi:hypothetical protein